MGDLGPLPNFQLLLMNLKKGFARKHANNCVAKGIDYITVNGVCICIIMQVYPTVIMQVRPTVIMHRPTSTCAHSVDHLNEKWIHILVNVNNYCIH